MQTHYRCSGLWLSWEFRDSSSCYFVRALSVRVFGVLLWTLEFCWSMSKSVENTQDEALPGLKVGIPYLSVHVPLAKTQSPDLNFMQGMLGNVAQVCPRRGTGTGSIWPVHICSRLDVQVLVPWTVLPTLPLNFPTHVLSEPTPGTGTELRLQTETSTCSFSYKMFD